MTKQEFEQRYAARCGVTVEQLYEWGQVARPCDCGEEGCEGRQMAHDLGRGLDSRGRGICVKATIMEASYTGIYFQLAGKQTEEYSTDELWRRAKEASIEKIAFPYIVVMPCGTEWRLENSEDFLNLPIEDILCPCGNPNHYIAKFSDRRESQ